MTNAPISSTDPSDRVDEALRSLDLLEKLQRVTDAALANLSVDQLLDELLIRVREALAADTAAILLLDANRAELVARAANGLEEEVERGVRIPMGRGFAGTIAASGKPLSIREVDHSNVLNPILRERGVRSLLGVPLIVQGVTLGVLHVGTLRPRHFTPDDEALLQLVGDRVALAIHAGLYERQRAVARSIQRSLLPDALPDRPGIRVAARYLPAKGGEVGGDWYDAFPIPDGRIAVAMGDVVGRGFGAAASMAKLRTALRAYAVEGHRPGDVLDRMDRQLEHLEPGEMATVFLGFIDPVSLTLRFASAAHTPPVIRAPDGRVRVCEVATHPPLGAGDPAKIQDATHQLHPGASLILYTDGLIERRHRSLDDGLRRLAEACRPELGPEERCDVIIQLLADGEELDDDVALLVVDIEPDRGDRWETTLPATADQLLVLRRVLERWLTQRSLPSHLVHDVLVASGEAAANAVQHAYGPAEGTLHVETGRTPEALTVTVRDAGRWRPHRPSDRGRGIPIMRGLADEARIDRTERGTTVVLRWRAGRSG